MVFDFISKRLRLPCRWPGSRPEETGSFGLCPRGLFLGDWVGVVVGEVGEAKKKQQRKKRFFAFCV